MTMTRFPTLLVLPATLWLAVSLGDKNCSITRPGGVKEPGVTNIKGECCSSFYSNSGNWDDCRRRVDRMAQSSTRQCQNTEARPREGVHSTEDAHKHAGSTARPKRGPTGRLSLQGGTER